MKVAELKEQAAAEDNGVTVTIYDRSGNPYLAADGETPATMTIVGAESKRYRDAKDRISRRLLKSRRSKMEPEDLKRNRIEQAAAAVTSWNGWEGEDGAPLPCSIVNVSEVIDHEHILAQVEEVVDGHRDFSSKNSSN